MSEFKRKSSTGGFEASEGKPGASEPDFSALEPESGFSVGEDQFDAGGSFEPIESEVELPAPQSVSGEGPDLSPVEQASPSASPFEPDESEPAKKRYYNPGEVMKKKGCIGCGGMVVALPIMLAIAALAVAIF